MAQKKDRLALIGLALFLVTTLGGSLRESVIGTLAGHGLGARLIVFLVSMMPIFELRGAVPLGIHGFCLPWLQVSLIALAGNILPVIPILFILDAVMRLLGRLKIFRRFFHWLIAHAQRKGGLIERYEYLGLFLFVAIPLPITGAWTGALIASVLRMPPWRSFLTICVGVLTADVIVTSFTLLGWWGLAAAVILLPGLWFFSRWLETKGRKKTGADETRTRDL
jgi:uncharacterized membrane protein